MRDSMKKEVVKAFRGSESVLVFQHSDCNWYISDGRVLISASFENVEEILVSLKIVPEGKGKYTRVGKKYTFREWTSGGTPLSNLLRCSINTAVIAPFVIEGEKYLIRPIITEGSSVTFINDHYTPLIRVLMAEPEMELRGNKDPEGMLHIVHNPTGHIRETIMVFAPVVVSKKDREEYKEILRIMGTSILSA